MRELGTRVKETRFSFKPFVIIKSVTLSTPGIEDNRKTREKAC